MYISVPVWILSTITENFQTVVNKKHECDTQRKSSNAYKKARIVKQYHLTPIMSQKQLLQPVPVKKVCDISAIST